MKQFRLEFFILTLFLFGLPLLLQLHLSAQGWIKNYGLPAGIARGYEIEKLPGGGFVIAGTTDSGTITVIARLDDSGDTLWWRSFPASGLNAFTEPTDLQVSPDSRIHAVIFDFTDFEAQYVQLDAGGNMLTSYSVFGANANDYLVSLAVVPDGVVFAGASAAGGPTRMLKRTFGGALLWDKTLPTTGGACDLRRTSDGGFALLVEVGNYDYEIVKTTANGDFLWRAAETADTYRGALAVHPDGNITYASFNQLTQNLYLLQFSPDGTLLKCLEDSLFTDKVMLVYKATPDADGNLYLCGTVWLNEDGYDHELLVVQYNPALERLGAKTYDYGETYWTGYDLEMTPDHSLIICGSRVIQDNPPVGNTTAALSVFKTPVEVISALPDIATGDPPAVSLWPNPFTDRLNVRRSGAGSIPLLVRFYTPEGNFLAEEQFTGAPDYIRVNYLPIGMLYYEIEESGKAVAAGRLYHLRP